MIRIDPRHPAPIWSQIEQQIRLLVASGALAPGASVPSVRELAADLRINPATVSKAYQRLSGRGTLEVRRGQGTFVAQPTDEPGDLARDEAETAARQFAAVARTAGLAREEAEDILRRVWAAMGSATAAETTTSSRTPGGTT